MNRNIRVLIIDTCGWITSISIIVFFFTLWMYSYNNIQEPLKESWSIAFSSLSALAAIGAAIVAATLFNDWKEQEEYKHNSKLLENINIDAIKFITEIRAFSYLPARIKAATNDLIRYKKKSKFNDDQIKLWLEESLDYRMKNLQIFSSLRTSLTRYIKYSKTEELDNYLKNIKNAAIIFSEKNTLDMSDKDLIVKDNTELLKIIKATTTEIEEKLLPKLDVLMSVKNLK